MEKRLYVAVIIEALFELTVGMINDAARRD